MLYTRTCRCEGFNRFGRSLAVTNRTCVQQSYNNNNLLVFAQQQNLSFVVSIASGPMLSRGSRIFLTRLSCRFILNEIEFNNILLKKWSIASRLIYIQLAPRRSNVGIDYLWRGLFLVKVNLKLEVGRRIFNILY